MTRYYLRKFLIFLLSMLIALCVSVLSFCLPAVAIFHGSAYVKSGLEKNSVQIIEIVNIDLKESARKLSVPEELLTTALNGDNIKTVCADTAKNFIYGYSNSFSASVDLYNLFKQHIEEHAADYSLNLSDAEINRISSYAVDTVDKALGSTDTSRLAIFSFVRSQLMMVIIIVAVVIIIGCVVALDMMNNGRHRKFNYIGMGLVTSGAINAAVVLTLRFRGYLEAYRFCSFDAYNSAVRYCFSTLFSVMLAIGIASFAVGFVMLLNTFMYFKTKKDARIALRNREDDGMTDYMDDYYTKFSRHHKPGDEFEKDIKKIDFEE